MTSKFLDISHNYFSKSLQNLNLASLASVTNYFVAAPAGRASNYIGGCTIHSLLHLMNKSNLKVVQLRMLQSKFEKTVYLIIDEYSLIMLGCKMLNMVDCRLRQIKCKPNELFGGLSIRLAGDYKQLPPVCDTCLWDTSKIHHSANVFFRKCFYKTYVFE